MTSNGINASVRHQKELNDNLKEIKQIITSYVHHAASLKCSIVVVIVQIQYNRTEYKQVNDYTTTNRMIL